MNLTYFSIPSVWARPGTWPMICSSLSCLRWWSSPSPCEYQLSRKSFVTKRLYTHSFSLSHSSSLSLSVSLPFSTPSLCLSPSFYPLSLSLSLFLPPLFVSLLLSTSLSLSLPLSLPLSFSFLSLSLSIDLSLPFSFHQSLCNIWIFCVCASLTISLTIIFYNIKPINFFPLTYQQQNFGFRLLRHLLPDPCHHHHGSVTSPQVACNNIFSPSIWHVSYSRTRAGMHTQVLTLISRYNRNFRNLCIQ